MIIEDTFTIHAPIQEVWDFFLDIERMSQCMPGVETVQQTSPTTYEGSLKVKVGPIAAIFGGTVEIVEQTAPTFLKAQGRAKDKNTASMAQGEFGLTLIERGPRETEIAYTLDLAIRGKLGQFGQTVILDTSKRLTAIFVEQVRAQLERAPEPEVVAVSEEAGAPTPVATPTPVAPPPPAEVNIAAIVAGSVLRSIAVWFSRPFAAFGRWLEQRRSARA